MVDNIDPRKILEEQEEIEREKEKIARKQNELEKTKREFESELIKRHNTSKRGFLRNIADLERIVNDTVTGLELGLNLPENIKNDNEIYKGVIAFVTETGLKLERETHRKIQPEEDRYSLSYEIARQTALELKPLKKVIEAEDVYKLLLEKGLITEENVKGQRRSIGIKIGRYLTNMDKKEGIFESVTQTVPRKYTFKTEIAESPQEEQPTIREIRPDLSALTDDEVYIKIEQGLKDEIFTEDQVRNIVGDKINSKRLNRILGEHNYTIQKPNGGGLYVYSVRHKSTRSDQSTGDIFILGLNRSKHSELEGIMGDHGVTSFTHIPFEEIEGKNPTAIADTVRNARHIICFPSIGAHKATNAIKSKINESVTKFLIVDSIHNFREYLSGNQNYLTKSES